MSHSDACASVQRLQRDQGTWILYGMLSYFTFMLNSFGPLLPLVQAELRLSYLISSLHASSFAAGMLLAGILGDALIRRLGRRQVLWLGGLGLSAASVLFVLSRHSLVSLGSALLMGTLGALLLVVVPALLAEQHGWQRDAALAEANVSASLSATLAPLLVGLCVQQGLGWRAALLLGVAAFGGLALWFQRVPALGARAATAAAGRGHVARALPSAYWRYWLVLVLVVGIEFCMIFWAAAFLVERGNLPPESAATAVALFLGLMVVGRALGAVLVRRMPRHVVLLGALALTLGGFMLFWLVALLPVMLCGLGLAGLGVANLYPLTLAGAVEASAGQPDAASAKASLATGLAILAAPLLLGALADAAGIWLAYSIIPAMVVGAAAMLCRPPVRASTRP